MGLAECACDPAERVCKFAGMRGRARRENMGVVSARESWTLLAAAISQARLRGQRPCDGSRRSIDHTPGSSTIGCGN